MRRFNYTSRQRIARKNVVLAIRQTGCGELVVDCVTELACLREDRSVPGSAEVYLEAYHRGLFERISLGTLAVPRRLVEHQCRQFRHDQHVGFRVKVVDPVSGRLIALGRDIRPGSDEEQPRKSLLAVTVAPLDGLVYKVEFPDGEAPILTLNQHLDAGIAGGIKAFSRDPLFVSLVFPSVVKEILVKVLVVDRLTTEDLEDGSAEARWLAFATRLNTETLPGEEDIQARFEWIDKATEQVGRQLDVLRRFESAVATGE